MTMLIFEGENPVLAKSQKIHANGMEAVAQGGLTLFNGYPKDFEMRYTVAGLFSSAESSLVHLLSLVRMAAEACNLSLHLADRDFPLHTTIGECVFPEGFNLWHAHGSPFSFEGQDNELVFSELVMDKSKVLLTASTIPEWFLNLRKEVNRAYTTLGFKALPIENLLHISLANIKSGSDEEIRAFAEQMDHLREDVKIAPPTPHMDQIFRGPSLNFLNSKRI